MTPPYRTRRAVAVALVLLFMLHLSPAATADAQSPVYTMRLLKIESDLRATLVSTPSERNAAASRAADELEALGPSTAAGPTFTPYFAPIVADLRSEPPNMRGALEQLAALNELIADAQLAAPNAADQAALREVLADPRFAPEPPPGWFARHTESVVQWIRDVLNRLAGDRAAGDALSLGRVAVVAAAVVILAATVVLALRALPKRRPGRREDDVLPERQTDSSLMRNRAAELARSGDFRGAVRASFVALLLGLHERGRLRYTRSLTNREHLARLENGSPLAVRMRPVVALFDDVWYGRAPVAAAEYEEYSRQIASILESA